MAQIQRRIARLPVRRKRQMMELDRGRFSGLPLQHHSWTGYLWIFLIVAVVVLGLDWLIALIMDMPAFLGTSGVLWTALGVTGGIAAWQEVSARLALPPTRDPKALVSALQEETRVAGGEPTQTELVTVLGTRAWAWAPVSDSPPSLILIDGGPDGLVCLRGNGASDVLASQPGRPPELGRRVRVESLRWTGAVISVSASGSPIPVQPIAEVPSDDLLSDREFEIYEPDRLPPELAELTGRRGLAYR